MLPVRKTASKSSMPKRKLVGESSVRKDREKDLAPGHSPRVQSSSETVRYCAYNQTRGLFLSNNVEAADSTSASLEDRLSKLKLDSGAALWFIPFRGLSATSVHFPIDLVYLNEDRVVLGAVESFPGSRVDPSVPPPASVLALPSRVIAIAGIQAGDQLILRTPEEIKRHLGQFQSSRSDIQVDPHLVHGQGTASHLDLSAHESADHAPNPKIAPSLSLRSRVRLPSPLLLRNPPRRHRVRPRIRNCLRRKTSEDQRIGGSGCCSVSLPIHERRRANRCPGSLLISLRAAIRNHTEFEI